MRDWHELAQLSESDLAKVDIAEMNLSCAAGLPGAERMDAPLCLERIAELGAEKS